MIRFVCTLLLVGGLLVLSGVVRPRRRITLRSHATVHPLVVAGAALAGASGAVIVTSIPVVAVLAAIATGASPFVVQRHREHKRLVARAHAWPGVIDDVTSAVRAGLDLPEALLHAGERAERELQEPFHGFRRDYARTGDFQHAVRAMCGDGSDAVLTQLGQTLIVARAVGGADLTQVLRSLGTFVRADLQIRGELEARRSWSVNSARMAVAAPWVVLVMLAARPATAAAYRSIAGGMVLLAIAGLSVIAYALMLRIAGSDIQ